MATDAARPPEPWTDERLARLRLARTPRIGPVTFHELIGHLGSAQEALDALPGLQQRLGKERIEPPSLDEIEDEIAAAEIAGARHLLIGDEAYPERLSHIADAPPALLALGDPGLLSRPAVAVVGARNASAAGRRIAADLAKALGERGLLVTSGMARGIDVAAHEAALGTGTAAVLASGVDVPYPPEHADLHAAVAGRGVVVSERRLGAEPLARHFPRRNRIISGLSLGVVVIEAALQSGSLLTARSAADQGREVFAVPGSPLDPRCRGSNRLIRDGARLIETVEDILADLPGIGVGAAVVPAPESAPGSSGRVRRRLREIYPTASKGRSPAPQAIENTDLSDLSEIEREVMACLSPTPTSVDEIVRQCHLSPAAIAHVLLDLELGGRLERRSGNMVCLA